MNSVGKPMNPTTKSIDCFGAEANSCSRYRVRLHSLCKKKMMKLLQKMSLSKIQDNPTRNPIRRTEIRCLNSTLSPKSLRDLSRSEPTKNQLFTPSFSWPQVFLAFQRGESGGHLGNYRNWRKNPVGFIITKASL